MGVVVSGRWACLAVDLYSDEDVGRRKGVWDGAEAPTDGIAR